jgi:vacuolar-type H+-ATPase subunit E/Vma4
VEALAPLGTALLARARADGDAELAAADAEADAVLAAARAEADAVLAEAEAQGERDAAAVTVGEVTHARRQSRATVLGAQRAAFEELRGRSRDAVRRLREQPDYPVLLDRLRALVRSELGADAHIREDPVGGIVGESPARRLDCTLDALAERAVDQLGAEVDGLWRP